MPFFEHCTEIKRAAPPRNLMHEKRGANARLTREEDALDRRECDHTIGVRVLALDPLQRPLGLSLDGGNRLDATEQAILLGGILDVGVDQKRVGLGVNVLHGNLKFTAAEFVSFTCLFSAARYGSSRQTEHLQSGYA